jgi:hypothetical protein
MDDDDAVVEGARAIRPYLGRLAGSSAVAAELDRHLADALNGSSGRQEPPASSGTCPTARKTPHGSWPSPGRRTALSAALLPALLLAEPGRHPGPDT